MSEDDSDRAKWAEIKAKGAALLAELDEIERREWKGATPLSDRLYQASDGSVHRRGEIRGEGGSG